MSQFNYSYQTYMHNTKLNKIPNMIHILLKKLVIINYSHSSLIEDRINNTIQKCEFHSFNTTMQFPI